MKKNIVLLATLLLAGCAYNQAPIVGPHDKSAEEFQQDMEECHFYAEQVDKGEAARVGAVNAGITGAALGAVQGLFIADNAAEGALVGAVAGGTLGAASGAGAGAMAATHDQSYVLRRCLASKGYDVFDLRD
ncbi:glycine zipper family protein [Thaumasiovibrio subtropicus]|uniref:glycine zipper family protein n=1 Tax=Thaumasiovibrio subtropicus TaxID=1891207 RepID=UPI000B35F940|nr:glycine zipper family protein [Thaumasiovibrio subtropicus]